MGCLSRWQMNRQHKKKRFFLVLTMMIHMCLVVGVSDGD